MPYHADLLKRFPVKFQNASALIGLNSGIAELDKLLGFIPKGKIVFIKGSRSRKHILELFCLRSIVQYHNYCIIIDGGNSFDPYLLSKLAPIKENPKEVLSRVIISRAFTCHQLASLIIQETAKIVDMFPTNFIAVSDMIHLFTDPESDIDEYEIEMMLPMMFKSLHYLANHKDAIVAVTSDTTNIWLTRMVESYSDIILTVNDYTERVNVTLDKHPLRQMASTELTLKHKPNIVKSATIERWLMING